MVGGEDHGAAFIPPADELEEQVRAYAIDGQVPDFVEDQESGHGVGLEFLIESPLRGRLGEGADQRSGRREEDPIAVLDGLEAQPDCEVSLPDTGRAQEDDVLACLHKPTDREGLNLLLIERGLIAEVEGLQGLDEGEAGEARPHSDMLLGFRDDLLLEDGLEEVGVVPLPRAGVLEEGFQPFATLEEPEPLAVLLEPFELRGGHDTPPAWAAQASYTARSRTSTGMSTDPERQGRSTWRSRGCWGFRAMAPGLCSGRSRT